MWQVFLLKAKDVLGSIASSKIFIWVMVGLGGYLLLKGIFKKDKFIEQTLPNSGSGIPKGWDTQSARLLATEANDVIDGLLTFSSTKELWAGKMSSLSNDQVTVVYNVYNQIYGKPKDETLTEAMKNEWWSPSIGKTNWEALIARLRSLKLY
jgi:hypothetical protein